MKHLLEEKFFPFVIKPARYSGGEPGQVTKSSQGRLKLLLASCERYETGQPRPILQRLYHLVNSQDDFLAERVFAPDVDAEQLMQKESVPLFSLESYRPAAEFDAIAFILNDVLGYCNLPLMLNLAGVSLSAQERTKDDPIIVALGPVLLNPEPLTEFIDIFLMGDTEKSLLETLRLINEASGSDKGRTLEELSAQINSAYVPSLNDTDPDSSVRKKATKIKAQRTAELKPEYFPDNPILPMIESLPGYLGIETSNRSSDTLVDDGFRIRPIEEIISQIEKQMKMTGYDEVRLLLNRQTAWPQLDQLLTQAAQKLERHKAALSVTALLPGTLTQTSLEALKKVRRIPISLNITAGNDRLRKLMGLEFSDDDIYSSVELIARNEWPGVSLRFTIGLPTETDDDLADIGNIVRTVSSIGSGVLAKFNTNVLIEPFIPLPHSCFQWDGAEDADRLNSKFNYVKKCSRARNVHFRLLGVNSAPIRIALNRGRRGMSRVILAACRNGCRFDAASPNACLTNWENAFEGYDMPITALLQPVPFDSSLPWSHIDYGKTAEELRNIRQQLATPSGTTRPDSYTRQPLPTEKNTQRVFGRGKKKVASRSLNAPASTCVRVRWSRTERHRYLSHLDNIRAIERAIRRSGIAVAYSQSASPKMKLSFCPPLPLGFTSETEFVDINIERPLTASMIDSLRAALPEGFELLETRSVFAKSTSLSEAINRIVYVLSIDNTVDVDKVRKQARRLLEQESIEIVRQGKSGETKVDIRPSIYNIDVEDDQLTLTLGVGEGGYVRPTEVARLLFDMNDKSESALKFHRREMYRQTDKETRIPAIEL